MHIHTMCIQQNMDENRMGNTLFMFTNLEISCRYAATAKMRLRQRRQGHRIQKNNYRIIKIIIIITSVHVCVFDYCLRSPGSNIRNAYYDGMHKRNKSIFKKSYLFFHKNITSYHISAYIYILDSTYGSFVRSLFGPGV